MKPLRTALKLPRYCRRRPLKNRRWAYFFEPPTWAGQQECPLEAEALGQNTMLRSIALKTSCCGHLIPGGRVACLTLLLSGSREEAIVPADNPFAKMGLKKFAPGQKKTEAPTATWDELVAFRMSAVKLGYASIATAALTAWPSSRQSSTPLNDATRGTGLFALLP